MVRSSKQNKQTFLQHRISAHVKGEEKQKFEEHFIHVLSTPACERLKTIIVERMKEEVSLVNDYDTPSWAYRQAHANGLQEGLKFVLDLLTVSQR